MPALWLSALQLPYQATSVISTNSTHANSLSLASVVAPFKLTLNRNLFKDSFFAVIPLSARVLIPAGFSRSLCTLLALGVCTINVLLPVQSASAETLNGWTDQILAASCLQHLNQYQGSSISAEQICRDVPIADERVNPSIETFSAAEGLLSRNMSSMFAKLINVSSSDGFQVAPSQTEQQNPFLDYARLFSPAKAAALLNDINSLEAKSGWRLRVITKSGLAAPISGKDLKDLWKPDERTVIVIEDISSPNILNFNAGADVVAKLPRQFFLELQSRYGNQFFVQQEGEGEALTSTVEAIRECLQRPEGCKNVPGLTSDLYYLTLATSIAGGCVFGFAARLPPSGRVEASWQWVAFLSPLWLLLYVSFGILPVVGRTSELEPLIKNAIGFAVGALALYLTPIFGPSPISRK